MASIRRIQKPPFFGSWLISVVLVGDWSNFDVHERNFHGGQRSVNPTKACQYATINFAQFSCCTNSKPQITVVSATMSSSSKSDSSSEIDSKNDAPVDQQSVQGRQLLTYKVTARLKRQKSSSSSSSSSSASDSSSSDSESDSEPEAQQQKDVTFARIQGYFQLNLMNLTSTVQILFDAEMARRLAKIVAYYFPHVKTLDYTHRKFTIGCDKYKQAAAKVGVNERVLNIPIFSYAYCPTMQGWRQEIDACPNKRSQDRMNCFIIAETSVKVLSDNALYDKLHKLEDCLVFLDHYYNTTGAVHSAYLLQGRASTLSTTDYTALLQKSNTAHPMPNHTTLLQHRPLTHLLDLYSKGRFFVFVD